MKPIDPRTLSTGAGMAAMLNSLHSFSVRTHNGPTERFERLDWKYVPDEKYLDRVFAVHRERPSEKRDLSHCQIHVSGDEPLWQMIQVPPAYTELPEGARLREGHSEHKVGTPLVLVKDANYVGNEVIPAGTVTTMAGYRTGIALAGPYMQIEFTPIARFPDGTYRDAIRTAVPDLSFAPAAPTLRPLPTPARTQAVQSGISQG